MGLGLWLVGFLSTKVWFNKSTVIIVKGFLVVFSDVTLLTGATCNDYICPKGQYYVNGLDKYRISQSSLWAMRKAGHSTAR